MERWSPGLCSGRAARPIHRSARAGRRRLEDDGGVVGENADDLGTPLDLADKALDGVV